MKKKTVIILLVAMLLPPLLYAQAQIVFNGGTMVISNGAMVVVANPAVNAITRTASGGGIVSEGAENNLDWDIGTTSGTYTVPFLASDGSYIPVSFTTSGASGSGFFQLSTYAGPNWQNSTYLPPTISNVNHNGVDNSAYVVDRFWQVNAGGYSTKPSLSNLVFTYRPIEYTETGNTITEANLQAQRWNSTLDQWGDYGPVGADNTSTHMVTVASVDGGDLFPWWTLVDNASILPVTLVSFSAQALTSTVSLKWITANEVNANYFTIQKTQDFRDIVALGNVPAAGNSSIQRNYSLIDPNPFSGVSFYRLKITAKDGTVSYSQWQQVSFLGKPTIQVYPNPATDYVNISGISITSGSTTPTAVLSDISGKIIRQAVLSGQPTQLSLTGLAKGTYILRVLNTDGSVQSFKIIKE
jgi:hypothetical protein